MRIFQTSTHFSSTVVLGLVLGGCAFLPGFGLLEDPILYSVPVAHVANQAACELQEFMIEHHKDPKWRQQRWVLADEDVNVTLSLQTDTSGNISFTGINPTALGFSSLQAFIASTTSGKTSVPALTAKAQAKRSRTVKIAFSVSPNALIPDLTFDPKSGTPKTINCISWEARENPASRIYLKDYLNNYFDTINYGFTTETPSDVPAKLLSGVRPLLLPEQIPTQFKIQSIELNTGLQLLFDLNAGTTPNLFGNGSAFIVPVNGLSLDYSPDYSHTIDITLKICNNTTPTTCYPRPEKFQTITSLMREECRLYAHLSPLLSGVTVNPPKDGIDAGQHKTCNKDGDYVLWIAPRRSS